LHSNALVWNAWTWRDLFAEMNGHKTTIPELNKLGMVGMLNHK
jgi:hypothetical protein